MSKPITDGINRYSDLIRRLYLEEKMSDAEVAAALPIEATASGVYHFRVRTGIKGHRRGAKSALEPHRDEVIRLYIEEKLTDGQIAARYDVTEEAVRRARMRWGVATDRNKKSGRFSREAQFEQIKDQLPDAWERSKRMHPKQKRMMGSAQRVGDEFGVSLPTAQKWLSRLGLVESRTQWSDDAPETALKLFDEGLSVPATARQMGIPEDTVRNWISKHRDLSNPATRRSHEERMAFRRSVSAGKVASVAGSGRFEYNGHRLDSSYEVRFVTTCDRLGLNWRAYDRATDGVCEVSIDDQTVRYAPDFIVGEIAVEVKGIFDALAAQKVRCWREGRGKLAMIMKQELLDFEGARDVEDATSTLLAACYLTPPTEPAYWD